MNWSIIITVTLIIWNVAVFALFGLDKHKAKHREQRISERTLMLSAALMGATGALLGMYLFRHKTKHTIFKIGVPLLLIANIVITIIVLSKFYY